MVAIFFTILVARNLLVCLRSRPPLSSPTFTSLFMSLFTFRKNVVPATTIAFFYACLRPASSSLRGCFSRNRGRTIKKRPPRGEFHFVCSSIVLWSHLIPLVGGNVVIPLPSFYVSHVLYPPGRPFVFSTRSKI